MKRGRKGRRIAPQTAPKLRTNMVQDSAGNRTDGVVPSQLIPVISVVSGSKDGGQQKERKHNEGDYCQAEFEADLGWGFPVPLVPKRVLIFRDISVRYIALDADHDYTV